MVKRRSLRTSRSYAIRGAPSGPVCGESKAVLAHRRSGTRAASGEDIQVAARTPEIEAEIVRLHYAEHWPVETIAAAPAPETTILI